MAPKHHSRMLACCSSEDKSDPEYEMEFESSESDSYSDEEKSNSKRNNRRGGSKNECTKRIKKTGFKWHKDDEIIVLKELYEFSGKNASCTKGFYEFVKKRLRSSQVSMNQMSNKIRGLRKEYLKNECRRKENGLEFSGPHHWEVFVLSKRIWGAKKKSNNGSGGAMKDLKGFIECLEEMEIDMNCLMSSCLEHLKREWGVQTLMYIELLSKKWKFDAKVRELISHQTSIHNPPTEGFQII